MTIENERDIEDYMKTLLDFSNPSHKQFCENYKVIRHFKEGKPSNVPDQNSRRGKKEKSSKTPDKDIAPMLEKLILDDRDENVKGDKKKKNKYVKLYSSEDTVLLKGRHHCDCQASKHRLVNNCLNCGRIVCTQEGSGPCLFCGKLVCSKEEQEFINAKTKQSQKLYENLMDAGPPEGWEKAVQHRDRLLEYDRTVQRRTKVIDDEGEYFSPSSVWLSTKEREKMTQREEEERKRMHASRLEKKFTLDFAGRQITEDTNSFQDPFEEEEEEMARIEMISMVSDVVNPDISDHWQPEYVPPRGSNKSSSGGGGTGGPVLSRVQDRRLLEMSDAGLCLSLHQPWASLLAHGIMRHEGRTWYSAHRGRLWIAAASKPPSDSEVQETENFFRLLRGTDAKFPTNYPTSCLLGCVTMADVLSQEEYKTRFPHGESSSPFVFICEDAQPLSIKFPVAGQHKIYKLDNKIHQAAQKGLQRLTRSGA